MQVEEGIEQGVIDDLEERGHGVMAHIAGHARAAFGRGHVITRGAWWKDPVDGSICDDRAVLWAACDSRSDGVALAY